MSAQGMIRTVLATGLQQALAKDAAAGSTRFVAGEFGPNVQAWLREVAQASAAAPAERGAASATQDAFTGDAAKLAEAIAGAAKKAGIYNGQVALTGPHLLMLLDDMAQGYAQASAHSALPSTTGSRTPADYAMEHGEYLAAGAEQLLKALAAQQALEMDLEEVGSLSEEQEAALSSAQQATSEATRGLRSDIYEFRKRHQRAIEAAKAAQTEHSSEQSASARVTERG